MESVFAILQATWREACRHVELERSVPVLARLLAHHLPIDLLSVVAFDWQRATILCRATGLADRPPELLQRPRTLRPADRRLLQAWVRRRDLSARYRPGDEPEPALRLLLGAEPDGSWLAGPLWNEGEEGSSGALLLRAQQPEQFEPVHRRLVEFLLEPFSSALEIDRRLHELQSLRQVAEADKRSALALLGRQDLNDEQIVGITGGLQPVMERVSMVAGADIPILLLGQTGTGKEVIARAIHRQSPRAEKPFIRVNCGAIPPELVDSELFGHEKGAFTGATDSRQGWFERADQGTLLLDEIGELPLPAQVRLLRVLQESTFERVGAQQATRVDVRIIAATHRDLPAMIQQGTFREDLWYRIAGFPIVLPPLAERRADIPDLARHLAQRAARRFGLRPCLPTTADLMLLAAYHWPGNIRELASVIDRAAILGQGQTLAIAQALGNSRQPTSDHAATAAGSRASDQIGQPDPHHDPSLSLDQVMQKRIEQELLRCRGRIDGPYGAARRLEINPHTLRARMKKLGIDWRRFRDPQRPDAADRP